MNKILDARKACRNRDALWQYLTGTWDVKFDDGIIPLHSSICIMSSYGWNAIDYYRDVPLTKNMVITPHLKLDGTIYNKWTFRDFMNEVLWHIYDSVNVYNVYGEQLNAYDIVKRLFYINMEFYNDAIRYCNKYAVSLDITDYLETLKHPTLVEFKKESEDMGHTPSSVAAAIAKATKLVKKGLIEPDGTISTIPRACLVGVVKPAQTVQAVFMRGNIPDIDQENIPKPITASLTEGVNTPIDFNILCREGALAQVASLGEISNASHRGKKLSLAASIRTSVVPGDCGSTTYLKWHIKSPTIVDGIVTEESNLKDLVGTYYFDDDEQRLKVIYATDTHLHGKIIKRRSVLTCQLENKKHVCGRCFGDLSYSMRPGVNVGISLTKMFSEANTQGALSKKHLLAELTGFNSSITRSMKPFFTENNRSYYFLKPVLDNARVILSFKMKDLSGITSLSAVNDVRQIDLPRIGSFVQFTMYRESLSDPASIKSYNISLGNLVTGAVLSYELLEFLKLDDTRVTNTNRTYDLDITGFNSEKQVFIRPDLITSSSDEVTKISDAFEQVSKGRKVVDTGVYNILVGIQEMLSARNNIPITVTELILSSYFSDGESSNLAKNATSLTDLTHIGVERTLLKRSLSNAFMFRSPTRYLLQQPDALQLDNRDDSPLDVFIDPKSVYRHAKKK